MYEDIQIALQAIHLRNFSIFKLYDLSLKAINQ